MGRPKGSRNKSSKTVPSSEGPVTTKHNEAAAKADLTEDQQRALLATAARDYEAALHVKNDASAAFIKVCKRIKGDGVSIDDVKTALKLQTPEGEAALKAAIAAQIRVARWYNSPIGTQASLFGEAAGNGHDSENAAYKAGKQAGLDGAKAVVPTHFDANEWLRGWQEGQAALASRIKQQKQRDADEFDAEFGPAPSSVN